ncbi:Ig-like domain-containing protein [Lactobacillus crispatus]|uniref:Ig-like domain-containing protein n=1 Tax=Lactobacillus crispatus TaxID=47770 RepID=UPI0010619A42|nr:Ig-like domain-containing protein [Lactobacillus crispatus]TDM96768.1 hypothetical protein CEE88_11165 [Lactobacillus crispatus]
MKPLDKDKLVKKPAGNGGKPVVNTPKTKVTPAVHKPTFKEKSAKNKAFGTPKKKASKKQKKNNKGGLPVPLKIGGGVAAASIAVGVIGYAITNSHGNTQNNQADSSKDQSSDGFGKDSSSDSDTTKNTKKNKKNTTKKKGTDLLNDLLSESGSSKSDSSKKGTSSDELSSLIKSMSDEKDGGTSDKSVSSLKQLAKKAAMSNEKAEALGTGKDNSESSKGSKEKASGSNELQQLAKKNTDESKTNTSPKIAGQTGEGNKLVGSGNQAAKNTNHGGTTGGNTGQPTKAPDHGGTTGGNTGQPTKAPDHGGTTGGNTGQPTKAPDHGGTTGGDSGQPTKAPDHGGQTTPTEQSYLREVRLNSTGTSVSGISNPNSQITISVDGNNMGNTVADESGRFTISFNSPLSNGASIHVTSSGSGSAPVSVDFTAQISQPEPSLPDTISFQCYTTDGTYVGDGSAVKQADGSYTIHTPNGYVPQNNNDVLQNSGRITVVPSSNPSQSLFLNQVGFNSEGTNISGVTVPNATVNFSLNGNDLGSTTADGSGNFSFNLPQAYTHGETVVVKVGNLQVNAVAPSSPYANISDGATKQVNFVTSDGSIVGTGTLVKENGGITIHNIPYGYKLSDEDANGNSAQLLQWPDTISVIPDGSSHSSSQNDQQGSQQGNTNPAQATFLNKVGFNLDGNTISGTTNPNVEVTFTMDGNNLGSTTADDSGNFSFSLPQSYTHGETVVVQAGSLKVNAIAPMANIEQA